MKNIKKALLLSRRQSTWYHISNKVSGSLINDTPCKACGCNPCDCSWGLKFKRGEK